MNRHRNHDIITQIDIKCNCGNSMPIDNGNQITFVTLEISKYGAQSF